MLKKIIFIAVLAAVLTAANPLSASPVGRGGRGLNGSLADSLNLTPEQREKVRTLRESYLKEKEPLRNQLYTKRMELKLLWMQAKPEPEKIRSKQREIHDLRWKLNEKRTNHRMAFRNILTPKQLAKYIFLTHDRKRSKKKKERRVRW